MSLVQLDRSPRKLIESKQQNSGTNKIRKSPLGRSYSLRNSPCTTPSGAGDTLSRSPSTRRTLRRGRPNTVSVGLTRPSPTNNILKLETSPPAATLVRSSSSTSSFRKETYLYSSNTSPRRKIVMDPCSGRVSGRNSGGRPVIPESLIPKPQLTNKFLAETEEGKKTSKSEIEHDSVISQQRMIPCVVSISATNSKSKSPSKEKRVGKPAVRSMSLRDNGRSYIPRPIANNNFSTSKRTPLTGDAVLQEVDEKEYSTPTPNRPQKSVSTSAITKTPLQRRNSVQELVQLFETSTLPKNQFGKIANHIENQVNVKPYTRTLERKKLEPFTLQLRQVSTAKFGSAWKLNEITQKNQ